MHGPFIINGTAPAHTIANWSSPYGQRSDTLDHYGGPLPLSFVEAEEREMALELILDSQIDLDLGHERLNELRGVLHGEYRELRGQYQLALIRRWGRGVFKGGLIDRHVIPILPVTVAEEVEVWSSDRDDHEEEMGRVVASLREASRILRGLKHDIGVYEQAWEHVVRISGRRLKTVRGQKLWRRQGGRRAPLRGERWHGEGEGEGKGEEEDVASRSCLIRDTHLSSRSAALGAL